MKQRLTLSPVAVLTTISLAVFLQANFVDGSRRMSKSALKTQLLGNGTDDIKATLLDLIKNDPDVHDALSSGTFWDSVSDTLSDNVNAFFLISMAIQVHIMQCGFALLETGCIRAKSATNSMWKNCVCGFVAAIGWYLTGFGFAFGKTAGGFVGTTYLAYTNMGNTTDFVNNANLWFFEYSFCTTAATIISGAIAERAHIIVFLASSFLMSSVTYPFIAHWVWNSQGWLRQGSVYNSTSGETIGFDDFAGSGVVHLAGGAASLAALILLKPRLRRFPRDGGPKWEPIGHSTTLVALGCMILSTEFVAFNAGSELRLDHKGDSNHIGQAAVNTMLAGASGFLAPAIWSYCHTRKFLMLPALCGSLAGNVAICAGCDVVTPWAALGIGFIAGLVYIFTAWILTVARLDDPVDAVGVHMGGGVTGLLTLAFLKPGVGVMYEMDTRSAIFLGWQICGTVVIFAWTFIHTVIIFLLLRLCKILHVSEKDETDGMDISHGHEVAYPKAAYVDADQSSQSLPLFLPGNDIDTQQLIPAINDGDNSSLRSSAYRTTLS